LVIFLFENVHDVISGPYGDQRKEITEYVLASFTTVIEILHSKIISTFLQRFFPFKYPIPKGPVCPSGYEAGLTNQTSLLRFPSPLSFS